MDLLPQVVAPARRQGTGQLLMGRQIDVMGIWGMQCARWTLWKANAETELGEQWFTWDLNEKMSPTISVNKGCCNHQAITLQLASGEHRGESR